MYTISLCMIVKNEEKVLSNCLNSIKNFCDEIIIVDTGSTDQTKQIAKKYTDKIFDFEWIDDFSAARNYAFSLATMDYIFWLDADDVLLEEDQQKLAETIKSLDFSVDAVSMPYNIAFDSFGNSTFSFRRNRLVKRINDYKWIGFVHEYLEVFGNIIQADVAVTHRKLQKPSEQSDRNLQIYKKRLQNGEEFTPRDLFYYANELKDHKQYLNAIDYYRTFLNTKKGWKEDEVRACINIAECYKSLDNKEREMEALALSFKYDIPRPEAACRLGDLYLLERLFNKAIIWYKLALEITFDNVEGFWQEAYATWYPNLQLCVCYWELGNIKKSIEHNTAAKRYIPNEPAIKQNELFFQSLDH